MLLRIRTKCRLAADSQRCCSSLKYLKSHSPLSLREMSLSYDALKNTFDSKNNATDQFNRKQIWFKKTLKKTPKTSLILSAFMSEQEPLRVLELQALDLLLLSMHMFWERVPTDIQQMVSGWTSGNLIRLEGTNL